MTSSWLNCTIEEHEEMAENSRDGVEEDEDSMKSELEFLTAVLSDLDVIRASEMSAKYDLWCLSNKVLDRIAEVRDWEVNRSPKGVELTQEEKDSLPNPEED